jgi:biopolymer transport protein ExbD
MLRLIDIVLILLFGFISISHIDRSLDVDLPTGEYIPAVPPDFQDWTVVAIDNSGAYICGLDRIKCVDTAQLNTYVEKLKSDGHEKIRLRVHHKQPGQSVAQVMEICRQYEVSVSLEVILETPANGETP